MNSADVPSPCVKVCQLDPATNTCLGCLRTLQEIADWLEMTEQEKDSVIARIESRQQAR
jgi:predicted Fe-S protein YdhL (DUF1289 family)